MKILLDENLDWRLKRDLRGHQVDSVPRIGWSGLKNGVLLVRAQEHYDVLMTMDGSLPHQQNLSKTSLIVIALQTPTNRLADTRPLMSKVLAALPKLNRGTFTVISR